MKKRLISMVMVIICLLSMIIIVEAANCSHNYGTMSCYGEGTMVNAGPTADACYIRRYENCKHYCPNEDCDYTSTGSHTDSWTAIPHNFETRYDGVFNQYRYCLSCGYATYN